MLKGQRSAATSSPLRRTGAAVRQSAPRQRSKNAASRARQRRGRSSARTQDRACRPARRPGGEETDEDGRQGHDQQGECAPDEANLFLEHRDVRLDGYEIRLHGREIRLDGREIRRDPVKGGGDRLELGADGAISPATEFRPRRLRQGLGEEPAGEEDALAVSGRADPVLRRRTVAEVDLLCAGFVRLAIPLTLLGRSTSQGTRDGEGHHRVERPGIRDEVPCLGIE